MAARAVDVGAIVVGVEAETSRFVRGISQAQTRLVGFGKSAEAVGRKVSTFGRTMSFAFTLPFLAGVGLSVKAFASFDAAMTKSLAIMGDVSDKMQEDMAKTAEEMSKQTTFAAKELAEAYFFLASAGFDAQQSMAALPTVAKFAQAGHFDLSQATELLGDSLAALGLQVEDFNQNMINMTRLSDVLVKANVLAQATTQQFAEALTRAAGITKAYKVPVEETVAVLAAFAKTGRKAEAGGESLGRLLRLLVPSAAKNAEEFKRLNIEVFNSEGNLRNLADVLGDMENAFEGMSARTIATELEMLGFQRRMQGIILPIIGFSKAIRGWEKDLRNAAGTTEDVAAKQLRAFNAQIKIMWNRTVIASKRIGKVLIPSLIRGAEAFGQIADSVERLDDKTVKWALSVGAVAAAIGPLLTLGGGLILALGTLSVLAGGLGAGLLAGVGGIITVTVVLGSLAAIVAGLGAGLVNLMGTGDTFGDRFSTSVGDGMDVAQKKSRGLLTTLTEIGQSLQFIGGSLALRYAEMMGKASLVAEITWENTLVSAKNFWSFLKSFFPWFANNWGDVMDFVLDASMVLFKNLGKHWKEFGWAVLRWMTNPLEEFRFDVTKLTAGIDAVRPQFLPDLEFETEEFTRDFVKELEAFQREIDKARENLLDPSEEVAALNVAMDAAHLAAEKQKKDLEDLKKALDGVLGTMRRTGDTQFADAIEEGSAAAARAAFTLSRQMKEMEKVDPHIGIPDTITASDIQMGLIELEFAPGSEKGVLIVYDKLKEGVEIAKEMNVEVGRVVEQLNQLDMAEIERELSKFFSKRELAKLAVDMDLTMVLEGVLQLQVKQLQRATPDFRGAAVHELPPVEPATGTAVAAGTFAPGLSDAAEVASGLRQLLEEDRNQTNRMASMITQQGRTNQLLEAAGTPEVVNIS